MTHPATRAVNALIDHAHELINANRHGPGLAAASRAVQAAVQLDDPALLVQALSAEGRALRMLGEYGTALTRYTRVLAIAEDTSSRDRLSQPNAAEAVTGAYTGWVECARFAGGVPVRELFGVLDAGERYLRSIGRTTWRSGLLVQRAMLHNSLGEHEAAVATGREALTAHQPGSGSRLANIRWTLGEFLRHAGRAEEAEPLYQTVLDDPDITPWERVIALDGLAWCALDRGDTPAGRRYATAAVREAEPIGDNALRNPLTTLIWVCLRAGDLDAAAAAAARNIEVARRLGGHYLLYNALDCAVAVALDRGQLDTAAELLDELAEHAAALDADTGTSTEAEHVARKRRRLTDLQADRLRAHALTPIPELRIDAEVVAIGTGSIAIGHLHHYSHALLEPVGKGVRFAVAQDHARRRQRR